MDPEFRDLTKLDVEKLLLSSGVKFSVREYEGKDPATKVSIHRPVPIEVWIYSDGAGILGDALDERFEKPDFHSLEALREAFIGRLSSLVKLAS